MEQDNGNKNNPSQSQTQTQSQSIIPESPPSSPTASQNHLLSKLQERGEEEDEDAIIIEDYDEEQEQEGSKRNKVEDVVIDMEVEMEMEMEEEDADFVANVERVEASLKVDASITSQRWTEEDKKKEVEGMRRLGPQDRLFPEMRINSYHTVGFVLKNDYKCGDLLEPYPSSFQSKWDDDHVPMPCARQNMRLFKVRDDQDRRRFVEERVWMWGRIRDALTTPVLQCSDVHSILKKYVRVGGELTALKYCVQQVMNDDERNTLFTKVLPFMQTLARQLDTVLSCPIPLLRKFRNYSITLSQRQIACLLANAFFCTFPKRFGDEEEFPSINFLELFKDGDNDDRLNRKAQKIRCLLNYFERITDCMPTGAVTFTRRSIRNKAAPDWANSTKKITRIVPLQIGTIEDDGVGMLQVDFANMYVGGGVLGQGCVQEEVLFVIYPELLVSRLFTEKLTSCEALIVTGCERFSRYTGYAASFQFAGDYIDTTPFENQGYRRCSQFVAIDAMYITKPVTQFHPRFLTRELNKAYVGFSTTAAIPVPVASGKWGCGAFRGDPQLKAILQLMSASQCGRDVVFFTFGDAVIHNQIEEMFDAIKDCPINQLWQLLSHYYSLFCTTPNPKYDLYQYLVRFGSSRNSTDKGLSKPSLENGMLKEVPSSSFYTNDDIPSTSNKASKERDFRSNNDGKGVVQNPQSLLDPSTALDVTALTEEQIVNMLMSDDTTDQPEAGDSREESDQQNDTSFAKSRTPEDRSVPKNNDPPSSPENNFSTDSPSSAKKFRPKQASSLLDFYKQ